MRFYYCQPLSIGIKFALPASIVRHLLVLRCRVGDSITLFNGRGGEYLGILSQIQKADIIVDIKAFSPREMELSYPICLAQVLPDAANKMDWIIEKSVELGVTMVQPLFSVRCIVRLDKDHQRDRLEKKASRWQSIIQAASEQCGRNRLIQLAPILPLLSWILRHEAHPCLLLSPRAEQSLSHWCCHHRPQALSVLIGPEGGFTQEEENDACAAGAIRLSMGQRVLRSETAGIVALAVINTIWGAI